MRRIDRFSVTVLRLTLLSRAHLVALGPAFLLALAISLAIPLAIPTTARADEPDERIEALERRVEELETERDAGRTSLADWMDRIWLSGSANTGYYGGSRNSLWNENGFLIWDARFFVDAELGGPVALFGKRLVEHIGFSFEWDLVRIGQLSNSVGDLYVEVQGIADSSWLNFQLGRFQVPIGEAYLRFGQGYAYKPFITNAAAGAWYWDEGLKLYGGSEGGLFSYVASISQNETIWNFAANGEKQYTLQLILEPLDWLRLSASGLYGGAVDAIPGSFMSGSALWLGEMWARPFGTGTQVETYIAGMPIDLDDVPQRIERTGYVGADVIMTWDRKLDIWLNYGFHDIDQGSPLWNRQIHAFVAEVVLHGGLLTAELDAFYIGVRATGLGTFDDGFGYMFDFRQPDIGYNMRSLIDYSVVIGWHLIDWTTLRIEYTRRSIDLVDGTPAGIHALSSDLNHFGIELGVHF
ncbi:MAG: hypothetical protein JRG92_21940 [Deltaproteobacteria bacterium]|nr:hypothetical protein [Deltaproteobacteria bacterium]